MDVITSHRYRPGGEDGGCRDCDEPRYRHWFTDSYDSPEDREMIEAMHGGGMGTDDDDT